MTNTIPAIKPLVSLTYKFPEEHLLKNGIKLYSFKDEGNKVVKLQLLFDSGRWVETSHLQASFCAALLKSGTKNLSAFDIAEKTDFLGSTIKVAAGYNKFNIQLFCLTRHLEACLEILVTILNDTIFNEQELKLHKDNRKSRLKVSQLKNDYVGDMAFKAMLYGKKHPYGYKTTEEDIDKIFQNTLVEYYHNQLTPGICTIGLIGNYTEKEISLINQYLGDLKNWDKGVASNAIDWEIKTSKTKKQIIELPNSVQASINIGKISISRTHEDYIPLAMLNMIFGGYFGSRLMSNIREEKGLTYGIYAYTQNYRHSSAFIINTDTAIKHIDTCVQEIYFEMDRLRNTLVPKHELIMARNYLLGRLLDQVDGAYKLGATFFGLQGHGLSLDYLSKMETTIRNITAEEIMAMAQKYYSKKDMFEVIVK